MSKDTARPRRSWWKWSLAGTLIGAMVCGVLFIRAQRIPALTEARFRDAESLWKEQAPANYSIRVEVKGMQPGIYEVQVENHLPVKASFDGHALTRQRTFGTWAVTGMFATLAQDLETNARDNSLMLGAEFDETYGIPRRYERIEMRTGAHDALQWEVTKFETD